MRLGIDLGGTKMEGIVLDENGRERFRKRMPTGEESGYAGILNQVKTLYEVLVAAIDGQEHSFGMCTPGATSPDGTHRTSNPACLKGKPLKKDLEELLSRKVALQNDANCFALAEALFGAGKDKDLVFGATLGTGCGGGIVFKKEVITGLGSRAGEWGHMTLDPEGPLCMCGKRGCVQTLISGTGLEERYQEQYGEKRSLREVEADYDQGDERAVEFMKVFFRNFGRALANLVTVLDPDIIVLGGGVSNIRALYSEGVREFANCIVPYAQPTPVVQNKLGDSAGVIGAALVGC